MPQVNTVFTHTGAAFPQSIDVNHCAGNENCPEYVCIWLTDTTDSSKPRAMNHFLTREQAIALRDALNKALT